MKRERRRKRRRRKATTRRDERRGEDADAPQDERKRRGAAAPRPQHKKAAQAGPAKGSVVQNGQRWSCDVGSGSQGGSWGARAAATGAGGVQRRAKRSAHLPSRCPERQVTGGCAISLCTHSIKKMERARHAREIRDLQEARARVSGLHGAWETQSAYGTHVGSKGIIVPREPKRRTHPTASPILRLNVGRSYIRYLISEPYQADMVSWPYQAYIRLI